MSDAARDADPPAAPRELQLLLAAAAVAVLPDLFDVDAFKTALVAVLAAALLLPRLLVQGVDDARGWFGCAGGRLHLLAAALAAAAALLGLRAAGAGLTLPRALHGATVVVAVSCLLEAVGLLAPLTALDASGRPEVVGTFGNSTRAGVFLAFGVTAAFATLATPDRREPYWRERFASAALLLGFAALLLTRARGGWLAAAAGLACVAWLSRRALTARWRVWAVPLVLGAGVALVLGDGRQLLAPKVTPQGPLHSGGDVTAQVRLSVWRGTLRLVADQPLLGLGLGRFRERFAPWREPWEAALPGREGLPTEVDHPHNELLLPFAEGGVAAGLCLLAFLALTLARAARRAFAAQDGAAAADGGLSDRAALALLVAGTVAALLQNAWTTPGTALPFFAAAGWAWRPPRAAAVAGAGARAFTRLALGALLVGLLVLALPRRRTHVQWWRFFRAADREGVNLQNFELLVDAADASPGDVDVQARLADIARRIQREAPEVARAVQPSLDRSVARLAELRPAD